MRRPTVIEFCKTIEKDYLYYLYKNSIVFPYCCHTSANLISSYLTVHFRGFYEHRVCKRTIHGWTVSDTYMIDFTGFQFLISDDLVEEFRNQEKHIKRRELYLILDYYHKLSPVISQKNSRNFNYWNKDSESLKCSRLYGTEFAEKIQSPYTLEGFMNYVEDALVEVDKRVVSDGLYRKDL